MKKLDGSIITNSIRGVEISFFVANPADTVQFPHSKGAFYEQEELDLIAEFFEPGECFVDIGANVGNHAIFAAKFLRPASVIVFEPNPEAVDILKANLALNVLPDVETSFLGVGLSDAPGRAEIRRGSANNLGATKLQPAAGTRGILVDTGDNLLRGRSIGFVKINVEGMELSVLRGLRESIELQRPSIYVNVDDRNKDKFDQWCEEARYAIVGRRRKYPGNESYMLVPREPIVSTPNDQEGSALDKTSIAVTSSQSGSAQSHAPTHAKIRLGIGVVTYNRRDQLVQVLEAVRAYTSVPYALVVADDGSLDGSRDFTRSLGVTIVGTQNKGIAWNKNRALYALRQNFDADVIILLEDDTLPIEHGWEKQWISASNQYGYVTYAHPKIAPGILAGSGTSEDPFACTMITSQCSAVRKEALDEIGFFDTRFKGYGVEDGEWTTRFRNHGYGIVRVERDGKGVKANCMISGGVRTLDSKSYRTSESVERNRAIFQQVRDEPVPRPPWRDEHEEALLLAEVLCAASECPLVERTPFTTPNVP